LAVLALASLSAWFGALNIEALRPALAIWYSSAVLTVEGSTVADAPRKGLRSSSDFCVTDTLPPSTDSTRTSTSCPSTNMDRRLGSISCVCTSDWCRSPSTPSTRDTNTPYGRMRATWPFTTSPTLKGTALRSARGLEARATLPRRSMRPSPSPSCPSRRSRRSRRGRSPWTWPSPSCPSRRFRRSRRGRSSPSERIVSATRLAAMSSDSTRTSTSWPLFTTSFGSFTNDVESCEMCTSPSDAAPMSTNAP